MKFWGLVTLAEVEDAFKRGLRIEVSSHPEACRKCDDHWTLAEPKPREQIRQSLANGDKYRVERT